MKAVVRSFHSPDADLETYASPDPANDALFIQILVGPDGEEGEESFDVVVCTAMWLDRLTKNGPVLCRHYLIMHVLDVALATTFLRNEIERLDEPTWDELATKIGRLGKWEFEDYRP